MLDLIENTAIHAAIIVTIVEAIRKRAPAIDGWRVIALAAAAAIILAFIAVDLSTPINLINVAKTALLSWVMAIGGNAWISKLVGKVGTTKLPEKVGDSL